MMEEIKKDYPDLHILTLDDFTISESDSFDQPGLDLDIYKGFKFLPSYSSQNIHNKILQLKHPNATLKEDKKNYDHISIAVYQNSNKNAKHTAFVLGDSFSEKDIDKYVESFSVLRHIFVGCGGTFNIFDALSLERKELLSNIPEIIIIESTERFLDRFLTLKFPED